ncbi:H+-ATPase G subunit-domain-containing protein [Irpex lacteus]|nr:H+-ATPase G subunit-domain-containing protein [Irpex lacteus]
MAAQQSQSIQTLLEAEKEAAKVVQQARQYRVQKLKDARTQATKEIEEYRKLRRKSLRLRVVGDTPDHTNHQAAIDKETEVKQAEIAEQYKSNKDAVVKKLLDRVSWSLLNFIAT